jgi:hypothetical protein
MKIETKKYIDSTHYSNRMRRVGNHYFLSDVIETVLCLNLHNECLKIGDTNLIRYEGHLTTDIRHLLNYLRDHEELYNFYKTWSKQK